VKRFDGSNNKNKSYSACHHGDNRLFAEKRISKKWCGTVAAPLESAAKYLFS